LVVVAEVMEGLTHQIKEAETLEVEERTGGAEGRYSRYISVATLSQPIKYELCSHKPFCISCTVKRTDVCGVNKNL
jgi:hypothetical protein